MATQKIVLKTDTFENQRVKINEIGQDTYNILTGGVTIENLSVDGYITESTDGGTTYWNVVTQQDVGTAANQVPLNQYLGQLAFLDDFSPNGLRREGGSSDDVVVNASGNVGIGTTPASSTVSLHIGKENTRGILLNNSSIGTSVTDGTYITNSNDGSFGIFNQENSFMRFGTNNTERLRIDSSGNVGIGTLSPSTLFHVNGSGDQYITVTSSNSQKTGIQFGNTSGAIAGEIRYASDNSFRIRTNNAERMRIDSSGNVGIGTSNPSPYGKLVVVDGTLASINSGGNQQLITVANSAITVNLGVYNPYFPASASLTTVGAHPFVFGTSNTERLRIDTSGRLLVGTSSARLGNVYASIQLEGSNSGTAKSSIIGRASGVPQIFLGFHGGSANGQTTLIANGNATGQISFNGADGTDFRATAAITSYVDGTPGANDMPGRLVFSTTTDGASSPTERMRIDSSGRLLIGTSSASGTNTLFESSSTTANAANVALVKRKTGTANEAGQQLHFYNFGPTATARAADTEVGSMRFYGSQPTSGAAQEMARITCAADLVQTGTHTPGRLVFSTTATGGSPTERLRIDSAGNVGIGTSSPGVILDIVSSSINSVAKLRSSSSTFGGQLQVSGTDLILRNRDNANLAFWTNDTERMRIDNSGRLLVGTSSTQADTYLVVEGQSGAATGPGTITLARGSNTPGDGNGIGQIFFTDTNHTSSQVIPKSAASIVCQRDGGTWTSGSSMPSRLVFSTTANSESSPTERLRIDSSGRLLLGVSSSSPVASAVIQGNSSGASSYGAIKLARGTATPADSDALGSIMFSDSSHDPAATIIVRRDAGTWTSGSSQPTNLTFNTTENGSSSTTERMRIDSAGNVGIANANPGSYFGNANNLVVGSGSGSEGISIVAGTSSEAAIAFADGTVGNAPYIGRIVYSHNLNSLSFDTNANERLRIDSAGNVGIGTSSPSEKLEIGNSAAPIDDNSTNLQVERIGSLKFGTVNSFGNRGPTASIDHVIRTDNWSVQQFSSQIAFSTAQNTGGTLTQRAVITNQGYFGVGTTTPSAGIHVNAPASQSPAIFAINTSEVARIDSSGRLLVGTSSSRGNWYNGGGRDPQIQLERSGNTRLGITRTDNTNNGPELLFGSTRGSSYQVVNSGDELGEVSFQGADGSELVEAANIKAFVDGTPGANDMPGRLVFSTTAAGASAPTERLRIDSSGNVGIGTTTPTQSLDVVGNIKTSGSLYGPANFIIDPAAVGDNTGVVRIKGDLYVDGTTTQINSQTLTIADFVVGIASTATTDSLADGAGINIGPDNTFKYDHTNTSLKSSENLNVASGKTYKVNGTDVLSATTLGSGVVSSSLTSVGTLSALTVAGDVSIADKIIHTGDTNTAIRFPAADTVTVETAGNERLRITSDGSVGIGTDNPTALIHAQNNSVSSTKIVVESTGTDSYPAFRVKNDARSYDLGIDGVTDDFRVYDATATAERLRITSTGEVKANGRLQESTDGGTTYWNVVTQQDVGTAANQVPLNQYLGQLAFLDDFSPNGLRRSGGSSDDVVVNASGNVGIGISSPQQKLHVGTGTLLVTSATAPQIRLSADNTDASDNDRTILGQATTSSHFVNTAVDNDTVLRGTSTGNLLFGVGTSEKLRITSAGLVGIGTTTPTQSLDVVGNIKTSGSLYGPANFIIDPAAVGDDTGTVEIKGNLTVQGTTTTINSTTLDLDHLSLGDNEIANFGASNDLQIYHDGSNSYIDDTGTGNLVLGAANFQLMNVAHNENHITATDNAQVELYHNGGKKFETTSTGATVTGNFEPEADATRDLGSATKRWANIYSADLQLSNEGAANEVDGTWGNYTIQEGEDDLFLINRRNGKKYKFNLTEV